jgi:hypothetical protein
MEECIGDLPRNVGQRVFAHRPIGKNNSEKDGGFTTGVGADAMSDADHFRPNTCAARATVSASCTWLTKPVEM